MQKPKQSRRRRDVSSFPLKWQWDDPFSCRSPMKKRGTKKRGNFPFNRPNEIGLASESERDVPPLREMIRVRRKKKGDPEPRG